MVQIIIIELLCSYIYVLLLYCGVSCDVTFEEFINLRSVYECSEKEGELEQKCPEKELHFLILIA